ncbi:MAG: hypothetical protein ACXVYW_18445, partial [Oryzihumus sp.]
THHLTAVVAATFAAGVAVTVLGVLLYVRLLGLARGAALVAGALVALLTVPLGHALSALAQLAGLVVVVVGLAVARSRRPAPAQTR